MQNLLQQRVDPDTEDQPAEQATDDAEPGDRDDDASW